MDINRVLNNLFIVGRALTERKGRMTLKIRRAFKLGTPGIQAIKLTANAEKSSMFQGFLKYDFLCTTSPNASIFKTASTVYIPVNILSIRPSAWFHLCLSF
jgi:hypothetical protein